MKNKKSVKVMVNNGKCEVQIGQDNLVYFLACEIQELKEKINAAENCLVCAAIADPFEICKNTLKILQTKSI